MRYFFHIAYQGDKYQGWQRQTNALGIQQIIEEVLSEVWNRPVLASGCGRTDAGVHATQFFFYSQLPEGLPENVIYILNRRLPQDISVFDIIPVPDNAHPQYDATARTYDYFLHTNKEAGLAGISTWYTEKRLNVLAIQDAIQQLPRFSDFRSYCKVPDRHNTTICDLRQASLRTDQQEKFFRFTFTADRFLRGMVRLLVGNLLEVGLERQSPQLFLERLQNKSTPPYANYAPSNGLYLSKVKYPYLTVENKCALQHSLESLSE